jgi:hypothetical protein
MQQDQRVAYTTVCTIAASLPEERFTAVSEWWLFIETVALKAEGVV